MIVYILTDIEYNTIQNQYYTDTQFFNCIQDINNIWCLFLSDEDKPEVEASIYAWVLNLLTTTFIPPPSPPLPPTL
jgi:hypothetical protein